MTGLTATPPGLRLGTKRQRRRRRRRSHGHHNNRPDRTTITPAAISSSSSSSSQSPILLPLSSGPPRLLWSSQIRIATATITTSFCRFRCRRRRSLAIPRDGRRTDYAHTTADAELSVVVVSSKFTPVIGGKPCICRPMEN